MITLVVSLFLLYGFLHGRNDSKVVLRVPSDFISLDEVDKEGKLQVVFWETRISILDADDISVYSTSVKDDDFIVQHNGKYYINEKKYHELLEITSDTKKDAVKQQ